MGIHFTTKNQETNFKVLKNFEFLSKMAFYIYKQPAFSMEHFHPGFFKPLRSVSRPRHWNLMENLLDQDETACRSTQKRCSRKSLKKSSEKSSSSSAEEGKMDLEISKTNEENKVLDPVTKTVSKRFMTKVSCQETMEKVKIKIKFSGHKFKAENLDVQVINYNVLVVKAEDDEEKFERKFKLSSDILVEKIESKFDVNEEDVQTLIINIPKDVKVTQVPIAMDE